MSCVNPKHPVFNKILKLTGNPLGSEILHDRLMSILSNEEQYNSYGDRLSESIAEDILLKSPALVRENPNVYSVHVVEGSNRILTFEQAFEVAKERASKINKKYSEDLRNIARVSTEKGDVRIFIEPNKQHTMDYIIKDMIAEEEDKAEYYGDNAASIQEDEPIAVNKAKEFNNVLRTIAKNIGVDVKFVDSLVTRHGMTLNGLFKVTDDLKGLIQISKEATDDLTLSEELSHAIIDGFEELPVVKNILRLVKSEGYESFLGDNLQDYKQLYAGNESKLIKEAAGKALSKALYNQFKEDSESKLTKAFKALWNRLKSIFGKVSEQTVTDLDNSLKELSIAVLGKELGTTQYTKKAAYASVKSKTRDKYHKQVVYLKRNLGRLNAKLAELDEDSQEYIDIKSIITSAQKDLAEYEKSGNLVYLKEAVSVMLSEIEQFVNEYEKSGGKIKPTETELVHIETLLRSIPELNDNVISLIERFVEMQTDYINAITSRAIQKKFDFDEYQSTSDKDIGVLNKSFNTLINIKDKLTYAIGFIIKEAQIKISSKQSDLFNSIKDKIALVDGWAAENGVKKGEMYNIFIQKYGGTTVLTRPYSEEFYDKVNEFFKNKNYDGLKKFAKKTNEGWIPYDTKKYTNPNYTKIMSDKRLKEFYNFYQKTITEALDKLPINRNNPLSRHFIPNIMMNNFSDVMKAETMGGRFKNLIKYTTGLRYKGVKESDFIKDESLERDIIPLKYLSKLTADSKSNDIGESLFKFAAFAIEHEHLSEILPKTRILQSGIARSNYISSTNDRLVKDGKDTNLHDMVDKFIQMQILGKKKEDSAKIFRKDITDESGNKIGEKGIDVGDLADFGLTWNSLLRIGLNPITAVTNVLVGDAGNIIEAFGGRFFTIGQLNKATGIFFKDITNSDSKVNHIIEKYPLMQELTDYEYAGRLRVAKGLTGEKLKNYMYGMQKSGEVFLQARTMIAMMLNTKPDGKTNLWEMLDDKGELKPEYKNIFPNKEAFDNYMVRLSAKIIGVNERIHGRYSSRDAAIINQNVLWRLAFQFKKWIPAAVETRFESYRYDERLGVELEGRWVTTMKLLTNLRDTAARMDRGELKEYEIYNLRKTLTEFVLVLGTIGLYMALGWDDDEKRKRSAMYKFTMDQLDRVSGDLLFWANPRNVTHMSKNPIAATKLVDDLITVGRNIPYAFYLGDYEYKSGPRKGENKFYSRLGSVVPGVSPTQSFMRLFNEEKYRDYTQ